MLHKDGVQVQPSQHLKCPSAQHASYSRHISPNDLLLFLDQLLDPAQPHALLLLEWVQQLMYKAQGASFSQLPSSRLAGSSQSSGSPTPCCREGRQSASSAIAGCSQGGRHGRRYPRQCLGLDGPDPLWDWPACTKVISCTVPGQHCCLLGLNVTLIIIILIIWVR